MLVFGAKFTISACFSGHFQSELSRSHGRSFYWAIMSVWNTVFAHRSNFIYSSWANWGSVPTQRICLRILPRAVVGKPVAMSASHVVLTLRERRNSRYKAKTLIFWAFEHCDHVATLSASRVFVLVVAGVSSPCSGVER